MNEQNGLVKIYTGGDVIISRIKLELEAHGIKPLIKDRFKQGLAAGFADGVPSAIDIFVTKEDFEKANKIINALIKE